MRSKMVRRIVTVAAASAIVLSLGGLAYAETNSGSADSKPVGSFIGKIGGMFRPGKGLGLGLRLNLKNHVEDGTLTQEQADKVDQY